MDLSRIALKLSPLMILLMVPRGSKGAELTDVVNFLAADTELHYFGGFLYGALREEESNVGTFQEEAHSMGFSLEFGAAPNLEVWTFIPIALKDRFTFFDVNEMVADPNMGTGTMVGTSPLAQDEVPEYEMKGVSDIWLGLSYAPFNEKSRKFIHYATWVIDLAVRFPTGRNFYEMNEEGIRGPGEGGYGFKAGTYFSKRIAMFDPYAGITYTNSRPYDILTLDDQDNAVTIAIDPADSVRVDVGVELIPHEIAETRIKYAMDIGGGVTYYNAATNESGVLVPDILDGTIGDPVLESEYLRYHAKVGFYYQVFRYMQIRIAGEAGFPMNHRLEDPYPIKNFSTIDVVWQGVLAFTY